MISEAIAVPSAFVSFLRFFFCFGSLLDDSTDDVDGDGVVWRLCLSLLFVLSDIFEWTGPSLDDDNDPTSSLFLIFNDLFALIILNSLLESLMFCWYNFVISLSETLTCAFDSSAALNLCCLACSSASFYNSYQVSVFCTQSQIEPA